MRKKYIGKELKPPFDGPKMKAVPNPEKCFDEVSLRAADKRWILGLIEQLTDHDELHDLAEAIEERISWVEENAARPDEVDEELWAGRVALEYVKCGKDDCACSYNPDKRHGPYWFHYDTSKEPKRSQSKRQQ